MSKREHLTNIIKRRDDILGELNMLVGQMKEISILIEKKYLTSEQAIERKNSILKEKELLSVEFNQLGKNFYEIKSST